ncbi:ribonuclease R [Oryzomicrobium sp.]|uniref:ribonuclease R n=1 Tax=Oryzomicrobium sp. TaxID=1911578 RepID=UPI002FE1702C
MSTPKLSKVRRRDPFFEREVQKYPSPLPSREYITLTLEEQGRPVSVEHLCTLLDIAPFERDLFERRLRAMEREGELLRNRKGALILPEKVDLIPGRVIGHPDGYGFLVTDDQSDDLYLEPKQMDRVLHGDRALARVTGVDRRGRREGAIVEVLERANSLVVGRVFEEHGVRFVVPENRRINQKILLAPEEKAEGAKKSKKRGAVPEIRTGQVVVVEIIEQPTRYTQPIGRVKEVLGNYADPGMEIEIALRKHDLPFDFSPEAEAETKAIPDTVRKVDTAGREDLTHLPLVTIDGETARDFDDAVFAEKVGRGYRLVVAIADVSHYVKPGMALDHDAFSRGNSVYFPRRVIPMLPEKLSNGLCSLNPDVIRLSMVCDMQITSAGRIKEYRFYPAVFRSRARLTYTQVWNWISGAAQPEADAHVAVLPHLQTLYKLFQVLSKARDQRAAIDFETTETQMVFNDQGKIDTIIPVIRNDAHKLIEECMLAANVCAANFLEEHKQTCLYRVHQGPTPEKLEALRDFLKEFGLSIGGGDAPGARDYAELLDKVKDRPDAPLLQTVMLRSLRQAIYSPDNLGHFGLAYEAYTHFTSPIRRYPDLLVHRAIKAVLAGQRYKPEGYQDLILIPEKPFKRNGAQQRPAEAKTAKALPAETPKDKDHANWESIGLHCSATERRADEATRDVENWLKCFYMKERIGEVFDGTISTVVPFGIFVALDEVYVEGLVHVSELGEDYFHHDPVKHAMVGERSGVSYRLGGRVKVKLVRADLESGKVDFVLVKDGAGGRAARRNEAAPARDEERHAAPVAPRGKSSGKGGKGGKAAPVVRAEARGPVAKARPASRPAPRPVTDEDRPTTYFGPPQGTASGAGDTIPAVPARRRKAPVAALLGGVPLPRVEEVPVPSATKRSKGAEEGKPAKAKVAKPATAAAKKPAAKAKADGKAKKAAPARAKPSGKASAKAAKPAKSVTKAAQPVAKAAVQATPKATPKAAPKAARKTAPKTASKAAAKPAVKRTKAG